MEDFWESLNLNNITARSFKKIRKQSDIFIQQIFYKSYELVDLTLHQVDEFP